MGGIVMNYKLQVVNGNITMIKKIIILSLLVCNVVHYSIAQDLNSKVTLQSISSIGLLNGSKGSSVALQTILGGSYQRSFLGIGVGLDYYRYRSIPLFADVRHAFGKGKRNVFLYGDIGYNFDWIESEKQSQSDAYGLMNGYSGGLYYDAGIGYQFGFNKSDALLISAGYTFKKLESEAGSGVCPFIGPCYNNVQTYRYHFSRLVIKAGWRF